jgi:hypothetical protein
MAADSRPSNVLRSGKTMKSLIAACAVAVVVLGGPPFARGAAAAETPRGGAPHCRTADKDAGFLDVSSDPPAKVFIDDADTGKVTPVQQLPLKAGHHKLTLVTADGAHKRTIGFTVDAGQTTKLSIHLTS